MIRYPAVAGRFYPNDPDEIERMIEQYLIDAKKSDLKGELKGIIVPHAGYVYSGPVAAYAYKEMMNSGIKKAVMLGPSHYGIFPGLAESGASSWKTPLGDVRIFTIGQNAISKAHEPEHSLEVQLPFLQTVLSDFEIAPLLTGDIDPVSGADLLENREEFFVISSDLSHYLTYEQAVSTDRATLSSITSLDVKGFVTSGEACGKTAIGIMMEIAKRKDWRIELLHYANSGDTAGPKSEVVGYAALAVLE